MKSKLLIFFVLYVLVPLVLIPLYCYKAGNWYLLFGVPLYYAGFIISKYHQWIFLPIPLIFAAWYWFTFGFSLTNYVTFYFVALMAGIGLSEGDKLYQQFVHKILPEQMTNMDYDQKVEELERRIDQFRKQHPGEKVTHELVEKIRTEVFFGK